MQEAYRIDVLEKIATFTITSPRLSGFAAESLFAPLLQENRRFEWYDSFISFPGVPRLVDRAHPVAPPGPKTSSLRAALPHQVWPTLLICNSLAQALELRTLLIQRCDEPLETSEPVSESRERFTQHIQAEGKHMYQIPNGESYGHVVLDIEPAPTLDAVIFENQVDTETIPQEFLPVIASALREAVFRGGPGGYPLSGFRATLIGGSVHPVDSNFRGYRSATVLALWDAFRLNPPQVVNVSR